MGINCYFLNCYGCYFRPKHDNQQMDVENWSSIEVEEQPGLSNLINVL